MILYTVVPIDDVLEGLEKEPAATSQVVLNGVLMEVEACGAFEAKVVRIISSNPNDYLASHHQPGFVFRWK